MITSPDVPRSATTIVSRSNPYTVGQWLEINPPRRWTWRWWKIRFMRWVLRRRHYGMWRVTSVYGGSTKVTGR